MDEIITPQIGMGCTIPVGSDSYPATIVGIPNGRTIVIQRDNATRTDNNGMSESQTYDYTPNPDATKETYTLRKTGRWVMKGSQYGTIFLGHRRKHHDFCR